MYKYSTRRERNELSVKKLVMSVQNYKKKNTIISHPLRSEKNKYILKSGNYLEEKFQNIIFIDRDRIER